MNRREFVEASLAASAALSFGTAYSHNAADVQARKLCVLFDARYSDARAFSQACGELGASVFAGPRDVVDLWRTVLRSTARPYGIAGLTTHSDLEIMQSCAAEVGLKLKHEIFHDSRGGSIVHHRVARGGSEAMFRELSESGIAWPSAMARAMIAPATGFAPARVPEVQAPKAADHPGTLVSWLLS